MSPSDSTQVTAASTATPANITEFNTIAGLIFAQLYAHFPVVIDPDRQAIANSFGVGVATGVLTRFPQAEASEKCLRAHSAGSGTKTTLWRLALIRRTSHAFGKRLGRTQCSSGWSVDYCRVIACEGKQRS